MLRVQCYFVFGANFVLLRGRGNSFEIWGDAEWKIRNYERILRAGVDEGVQWYVEFQKCWENVTEDCEF